MSAEIQRKDLITDDALEAPMILAAGLDKVEQHLINIRKLSISTNVFAQQSTSIKDTTDSVSKLVNQEKELVTVQKQLSSALAKDSEEYINYKKQVDAANQALKDKIALGEKDAKQITAANASMKELEAALKKNKQAYANLTNEQARSSKEGKALLATIQKQDKQFKDLNKTIGQHQTNVGNYGSALDGLDTTMGGMIGRVKQLGQAFLAMLSNPVILAISAVVGLFVALKSAANTYYTTTAEGEERMKQHQATWNAFFLTLKQGWAEVGKAVDEAFGDNGLSGLLKFILGSISPRLAMMFDFNEQRAQKLAKITSQLVKDHAADVVDDANTELKANQLIEISRNKLDYSAEQRMAALKEHNRIKNEQLEGDIKLAKDDLAAFDQRIKLEREGGKLLEEDITKRAQLEAALIKVQSDASAARTGFLKLEKALADEIHKDAVDALNARYEAEIAAAQKLVEDRIQLVRDDVVAVKKIRADGDKEIAAIIKANAAALIQAQIDGLNKLLLEEEFTDEEKAEIARRLAKLKIDLNKAVYDNVVTLDEATVTSAKLTTDKLFDIYSDFTGGLTDLFSAFSERRLSAIDAEILALEEQTERELMLAGDNDAAKEQIELKAEARREQLEKKKKAEQNRQAQAEKRAAIIQSLINTAVAYTKALPNIPLAALTAILGAIQTAAIIAQPLPQFFVGTNNSPEGPAWVGERGSELKIEPSGKVSLTPGVPTIDYLKAGTQIIPHDESMKMLAQASFGRESLMHREQLSQLEIARGLNELKKENKSNTDRMVNAMRKYGSGKLYREGSILMEAKEDEKGNRKLIRKSNLSR
jgi:hypothetical protein